MAALGFRAGARGAGKLEEGRHALLQSVALQDCYGVRMARNSERAERLEQHIKTQLAPSIAAAIAAAPRWRPRWPRKTATQLLNAIKRRRPPRQTQVPRLSR